jgi:hypothetical protein
VSVPAPPPDRRAQWSTTSRSLGSGASPPLPEVRGSQYLRMPRSIRTVWPIEIGETPPGRSGCWYPTRTTCSENSTSDPPCVAGVPGDVVIEPRGASYNLRLRFHRSGRVANTNGHLYAAELDLVAERLDGAREASRTSRGLAVVRLPGCRPSRRRCPSRSSPTAATTSPGRSHISSSGGVSSWATSAPVACGRPPTGSAARATLSPAVLLPAALAFGRGPLRVRPTSSGSARPM